MGNIKNINDVYAIAKGNGAKVGTFSEFRSFFEAPGAKGYQNRKKVHGDLVKKGLYKGSYEDFAKDVGLAVRNQRAAQTTRQSSSNNKTGINNDLPNYGGDWKPGQGPLLPTKKQQKAKIQSIFESNPLKHSTITDRQNKSLTQQLTQARPQQQQGGKRLVETVMPDTLPKNERKQRTANTINRIYDTLDSYGAKMGTRDSFNKFMYGSYTNRKKVYDDLVKVGEFSGSYDDFMVTLGMKSAPNKNAEQWKLEQFQNAFGYDPRNTHGDKGNGEIVKQWQEVDAQRQEEWNKGVQALTSGRADEASAHMLNASAVKGYEEGKKYKDAQTAKAQKEFEKYAGQIGNKAGLYKAVQEAWHDAWVSYRDAAPTGPVYSVGWGMNMSMQDLINNNKAFDLSSMATGVFAKMGNNVANVLMSQNPGMSKEEALSQAEGIVNQYVYNYAVQHEAPKNSLEFFARKVVDGNTAVSIVKGLARAQSGSVGTTQAAQDAMQRHGEQHGAVNFAGDVTAFGLDLLTNYPASGAGQLASSLAAKVGAKGLVKKGVEEGIAKRLFMSTPMGRFSTRIAGGAGNMFAFEGIKGASQQVETGEYDVKELGLHMLKGAGMGAITGVAGHFIGNAGDKAVKLVDSGYGKAAIKFGTYNVSKVTEGTIFAAPDVIANVFSDDPNKPKNSKIILDSVAMMYGLGATHGVKDAASVIASTFKYRHPRNAYERKQNMMSISERIANYYKSHENAGLSQDELNELNKYGYGDFATLFNKRPQDNKPKSDGKHAEERKKWVDAQLKAQNEKIKGQKKVSRIGKFGGFKEETINVDQYGNEVVKKSKKEFEEEYDKDIFNNQYAEEQFRKSAAPNQQEQKEFDVPSSPIQDEKIEGRSVNDAMVGYDKFVQMYHDRRVSQATREKMMYMLTGHISAPKTIVAYRDEYDFDGKGTVETLSQDGDVVTRKTFASEADASKYIEDVKRQIELNIIEVGEQNLVRRYLIAQNAYFSEAIKNLYSGRDFNEVVEQYNNVIKGKDKSKEGKALVKDIKNYVDDKSKDLTTDSIRASIKSKTGVDVYDALKKKESDRTKEDNDALVDYYKNMYEYVLHDPNDPLYDYISKATGDYGYTASVERTQNYELDDYQRRALFFKNRVSRNAIERDLGDIDIDSKSKDELFKLAEEYENEGRAYIAKQLRDFATSRDEIKGLKTYVEKLRNRIPTNVNNLCHSLKNKESGKIVRVGVIVDGKETDGYLISGNISFDEKGFTDKGKSSGMIIVKVLEEDANGNKSYVAKTLDPADVEGRFSEEEFSSVADALTRRELSRFDEEYRDYTKEPFLLGKGGVYKFKVGEDEYVDFTVVDFNDKYVTVKKEGQKQGQQLPISIFRNGVNRAAEELGLDIVNSGDYKSKYESNIPIGANIQEQHSYGEKTKLDINGNEYTIDKVDDENVSLIGEDGRVYIWRRENLDKALENKNARIVEDREQTTENEPVVNEQQGTQAVDSQTQPEQTEQQAPVEAINVGEVVTDADGNVFTVKSVSDKEVVVTKADGGEEAYERGWFDELLKSGDFNRFNDNAQQPQQPTEQSPATSESGFKVGDKFVTDSGEEVTYTGTLDDGRMMFKDSKGNEFFYNQEDINEVIEKGYLKPQVESTQQSTEQTQQEQTPPSEGTEQSAQQGTISEEHAEEAVSRYNNNHSNAAEHIITDGDYSYLKPAGRTRGELAPVIGHTVKVDKDGIITIVPKQLGLGKSGRYNIIHFTKVEIPYEDADYTCTPDGKRNNRTQEEAEDYKQDLLDQNRDEDGNLPSGFIIDSFKIAPNGLVKAVGSKGDLNIYFWLTEEAGNRIKRMFGIDETTNKLIPKHEVNTTEAQTGVATQGNSSEPMPMIEVGAGKNKRQTINWTATTPERGHQYLYAESQLPEEAATRFVDKQIENAQKNLDKLKKSGPKDALEIFEYQRNVAEHEKQLAEAQKLLDYWNAIKAEHERVKEEEAKAESEQPQQQGNVQAGVVSDEIKQKWNDADKEEGAQDEITLPNGETISGHYVIVESGVPTASHQSTNGFSETEGFPTDENGQTVNDRDYKRDQEAQQVTRQMANSYDQRAVQSPVVVSQDGVVLSGNGRTMAGEIAALQGTDTKYNDYLRTHAEKFGLTAEQVGKFKHPRLVFVADGETKYDANTFAKFNQREMKSQSKTEKAVKMGKLVDDHLFGRVMDTIDKYKSLSDFYADDNATHAVIKQLAESGIIQQTDMADLFDGGKLSEAGQALVESILIGKVFDGNPDAVRQITDVKSMRKSVMNALTTIVANNRLRGGYSLADDLAQAVDLVHKARQNGYKLGDRVSSFAGQGNLFAEDGATVADYKNASVMMLADVLNDNRMTQLKKVLQAYNERAKDPSEGTADIFTGEVTSKQDIINEINEQLGYGRKRKDSSTETTSDRQGSGSSSSEQGTPVGKSNQGNERSGRLDETNSKETEAERGKQADVPQEYVYQLTQRPYGIGSQPEGETRHVDDGSKFGAVVYDHPLSAEEAKNFSLTPITEAKALEGRTFEVPFGEDKDIYHIDKVDDDGTIHYHVNDEAPLQSRYHEFLSELGDEAKEIKVNPETGDETLLDVDGNPIVVKTSDDTVELNYHTWQEEKEQVRKALEDGGLDPDFIDGMMSQADVIAEGMKSLFGKYPMFGAYQNKEKGKQPILRNTGEYISWDYSFNCIKKDAINAVIESLVADGKSTHLGITQMEALKSVLQKHGFLTPCVMCYVEAKRKIYKQSKEIADKWNAVAEAADLSNEWIGEKRELTNEQRAILTELAKGKGLDRVNNFTTVDGEGIKADTIKKIAKLMLNSPELCGRMNFENMMSPSSFSKMYNDFAHTGLMDFLTQGQSRGKSLLEAVPFSLDNIPQDLFYEMYNPVKLADLGGLRQFSYEDARAMMFFDYYQQFLVMQGARALEHLYTKRPFFVEMFGKTGAMMNQSLIVDIFKGANWHKESLGLSDKEYTQWLKENAGFIPRGALAEDNPLYEKGSMELVPNYSVESFPVDIAMKNIHNPEYNSCIGNVIVAPNVKFILWALDNPEIHQILAYHANGANPIMKSLTGYDLAEPMDDGYHTKKNGKSIENLSVPDIGLEIKGKTLQWNKLLRKNGYDARKAAQVYLDYCKEHGLTPMFCYDGVVDMSGERATSHPNYYKLLTDFRVYDDEGNSIRQRSVKAVIPDNWKDILDKYLNEEQTTGERIKQISMDEGLRNDIDNITRYASMESNERDTFVKLLKDVYGKENISVLGSKDFDKMLDEAQGDGTAEMLRNKGGIVYGFAVGDKIVLNEDYFNAHTPMHEHTHIFMKVLQATNPRLYKRGMDLWRGTDLWEKARQGLEMLGEEPTDEKIFSECISQFTGAENEQIISKVTGITDKNWLRKAMSWIKDMWDGVKSSFSRWTGKQLDDLTAEQFGNMPIRALYDDAERAAYKEKLEQYKKAKGILNGEVEMHSSLDEERRVDRTIRDVLIEHLRDKNAIDTFNDEDLGQRILDDANKRGESVRLHSMLSSLMKAEKTITSWIKSKARGKSFQLELPQYTQLLIRRVMGKDYDSHNIAINGIKHGFNNHGTNGRKLTKRSIPIREEDAALIPYIITAPDYVRKGSTDIDGRESINFYKTLSNGYVVVVEKEYKNSPDDMETINIWAEMSDKAIDAQRNAAPGINVQNAILDIDAAKIRKDAEDAIRMDTKIREQRKDNVLDAQYLAAVERGDMETAKKLVATVAKNNGYESDESWKMSHEAPDASGYYPSLDDISEMMPDIYSENAFRYYGSSSYDAYDVIRTIQSVHGNPDAMVTIYRAVPADIKDGSARNGDWVTLSREYAKEHGISNINGKYRIIEQKVPVKHLYSDGNSIFELGYDDGKNYNYRNTKNNRKLKDVVTYDDKGNIIPLSKRFNYKNSDTRFFRTKDGVAYGFTVGGKVYIDPRVANSETPIHEYSHLWATAMQKGNPDEWNNIVKLMKGTSVWDEVRKTYPELENDSDIADEVLAHYSGRRGAERLREKMRAIADGKGSPLDKADAMNALHKVKAALNKFWKGVADFLGIHFTTAEEVADRVMKDLLDGVDPRAYGEDGRSLVGVHNISEDKLKDALKRGGLANPSVAVIDGARGSHEGYGEISLILPSDKISKSAGKNAGTFIGDAYTPRFPSIERSLTKEGQDKLHEAVSGLPSDIANHTFKKFFTEYVPYGTTDGLHYWFLQDTGRSPEIVTEKRNMSDKDAQWIRDNLGKKYSRASKLTEDEKNKLWEISEKNGGKTKADYLKEKEDYLAKAKEATSAEVINKYRFKAKEIENLGMTYGDYNHLREEASKENGKVDFYKTLTKASEKVNSERLYDEVRKWAKNKLDELGVNEEILVGHNAYGEPIYKPATLKNISKEMKKKGLRDVEGLVQNFHSFSANVIEATGNLDKIRKRKSQLTQRNSDEYKQFDRNFEPLFWQLVDSIRLTNGMDRDWGYKSLKEIATQKDPIEYAKKNYPDFATKYNLETLEYLLDAIKSKPTAYFETKFQRPVEFNEFSAALVPWNADLDVVRQLMNAGIKVYQYDPQKEGDRKRALREATTENEGIRFQKDTDSLFHKEETRRMPVQEYAKLDRAIHTHNDFKNGRVKGEFTDNNYYLYTHHRDGSFDIEDGFPIVGNEEIIKKLQDGIKKGTIRNPRDIDSALEGEQIIRDGYNSSNADAEGRPRSNGRFGSLDAQTQQNGRRSDESMGERVSGLSPEEIHSGGRIENIEEEAAKIADSIFDYDIANSVYALRGQFRDYNTKELLDHIMYNVEHRQPKGWVENNRYAVEIIRKCIEARKRELDGKPARYPKRKDFIRRGKPLFRLKDGTFIKSGSYFSGGGLLEEGLKRYLDPNIAVEFNEKISGVYADNFGNHIVTADVRDVDPRELAKHVDGEVQYFHASPVCKNYSRAKRDGGEVELDKETAQSTADFISAKRPKVVTIENVKGYKDSEALKIITDELTKQGYDWDMGVYNAADYGGYTKRERLIIRAVRDGKLPEKPQPLPESERKHGWMEAVEDLIDDLPEKKNGVQTWMDERLKAEGIDYRKIDKPLYVFGQGNNAHSVPHAFADELIPTLRTHGGDVIIMPDGRVLQVTPRVLARLTGLGDDYVMPKTDKLAHTIIGNGIPTQLSENVIGPLLDHAFNGGERASSESMITDKRNAEKRDATTQLTSALHLDGEVEILDTNEGLEGKEKRAKGWYDPKTGKITVVLGNHESVADVQRTIFHEAVAHKGLRAMVGEEKFGTFIDNIYKNADKEIQARIDELAETKYKGNKRVATEEYMASLAEDMNFEKPENKGLLAKVKKLIVNLLKEAGIDLGFKLTDKDLRYMLWRSYKNLQENGGKRNIFDIAEDARMRERLEQTQGAEERAAKEETQQRMFRDGNDTLKGVVDGMRDLAQKMVSDQKEDKQKTIDSLTSSLRELNKAMSAQRAYDLSTVKSVTGLVKDMLDSKLIQGVTDYEQKRMLSVIENVHGKNDTRRYVTKLMDIAVGNMERNASSGLMQLLHTRGQKVDQRGVVVQKGLDPDGQKLAGFLKSHMGSDAETINNRMIEVQNRMSSNNEAIAESAAIEYQALQLADYYRQYVKDSKENDKQLRQELADTKEKWDAGEIQMTKADFIQYRDEINFALLQNKIGRAQALQDLISNIGGQYKDSAERAKAWQEQEKKRVGDIYHNANSDLEGVPCRDNPPENLWTRFTNGDNAFGIAPFLFEPQITFANMLEFLGSKNATGRGYLYNRYMHQAGEATNNEIIGYRSAVEELDNKSKEMFGKDFTNLMRQANGEKPATLYWMEQGEQMSHQITVGNMLYIYMVNKMADGRMKLRKMGISDENVNAIVDKLNEMNPSYVQFADWMQKEFLPSRRNKYNEVHKRMFGTSMPEVEDYFPLKILKNAINQDHGVDATQPVDKPSTTTGAIKKRTRNSLPLDLLNADAFEILLGNVKEMEHWAAFAEFNRDINTLLNYKKFRSKLQNMTSLRFGSGKDLLNNFTNACKIATGTFGKSGDQITKSEKSAVNATKLVTAAKIAFRINTALKQLLSFPAYFSDANPLHIGQSLLRPDKAWKFAMTLPQFRERFKGRMAGDPMLAATEADWKAWRSRTVELAAKYGMSPNAFVDAVTVSIGAHAMYKTRYQKLLKQGYDPKTADAKAREFATEMYNKSQQSSVSMYMSPLQSGISWYSRLLTLFRNASMAYSRQTFAAMQRLGQKGLGGKENYQTQIDFMTKQFERDGIDHEQAVKNAKSEFWGSIGNDAVRVAVFNSLLAGLWNLGSSQIYQLFGSNDEDKKKLIEDSFIQSLWGGIEGLTGGDIWSNIAMAGVKLAKGEADDLGDADKNIPMVSDMINTYKYVGHDNMMALQSCADLIGQAVTGVAPTTVVNVLGSIWNLCFGDTDSAVETTMLWCKIINAPKSSMDKVYLDEIGTTLKEGKNMSVEEIAERYAEYKRKNKAALVDWAYSDEDKAKANAKYAKEATDKAREVISGEYATDDYKKLVDEAKQTGERQKQINDLKDKDPEEYRKQNREFVGTPEHRRYKIVERQKYLINKEIQKYLREPDPNKRAEIMKSIQERRDFMVTKANEVK